MLVLLPSVEQEVAAPYCFMMVGANMRRDAISVSLSPSLADCKALCAEKTEVISHKPPVPMNTAHLQCEACTFNSNSGKCVLLGQQQSTVTCTCAKPYLAYEKRSCSSSSTTSPSLLSTTTSWTALPSSSSSTTTSSSCRTTTEYSDDPCVVCAFPELTNYTSADMVLTCPRRNPDGSQGPLLVIRFVKSIWLLSRPIVYK